jgi:hypothetical protein
MNGFLEGKPGYRLDRRVACTNLVSNIVNQILFDLHERGPENIFGRVIGSPPEGIVRIIFGF